MNGMSTRQSRSRDPADGASRSDDDEGMAPGASGPNTGRREPRTSVGSGAERQRYRAAPIGRRGHVDDPPVNWSAASPNEGGTAEGTTFRPGTKWSFLDSRGASAMTTSDPISLVEAQRLSANADTI